MLALLACWLDEELAASWTAVLARWVNNQSAAGCCCNFKSASGMTAVLANRRDVESAAELMTGLLAACWCDDKSAAGRTSVLALLARWLDNELAARRMVGLLAELMTSRQRG